MPWPTNWSSRYLTAEAEIQVTSCQHFNPSEWGVECPYVEEKWVLNDWLKGIQQFCCLSKSNDWWSDRPKSFDSQILYYNFLKCIEMSWLTVIRLKNKYQELLHEIWDVYLNHVGF